MADILVIGAGITGGYTATRLLDAGANVALLARGAKADRLEKNGLTLRDAITGDQRIARVPIVREPVEREFDLAMACVQDLHRPAVEELLSTVPGRPIAWFLGNTMRGFDSAGGLLGRDRVLGGFPSVGGTWEDEVLVYADRQKPDDAPFNELVVGAAFPESASALEHVEEIMRSHGQGVVSYDPILAWHYCHVALILPLAAVAYRHEGSLEAAASDTELLKRAVRASAQGFAAIRRLGYPILPRRLSLMRLFPSGLGARKVSQMLRSRFGAVALAGHANTAQAEMHELAARFLETVGTNAGDDLVDLLGGV